ncbi:hypothetical protein GLOIN_2v1870819 [Rhizophagus irregularis DAOM 181602=DAOM 197198]|uniref:Uncharacterized protein n=1 Tax=Rhizophagus irregularis (strain DAOM 181602 / DAOM 197198 / MUCL 43194) TaxID=747089 RepID=A0A2P4QK73_RHIID|nr:hypothetical protein GLOIN_2v1870819 [Rhizophagus irregularis DAOM 181602=DAOM 197198]POG78034.1 hypothetical protein GLOIN_2v1870819 [Rhizophagus irregularis DAOM 181602=DAOM 197198]|eukprot:XP_025184900.1 hypothetical protein GLOIN_2v1870819 [Rhizophagus irregularis DAOM 181602=DAOM 197198]
MESMKSMVKIIKMYIDFTDFPHHTNDLRYCQYFEYSCNSESLKKEKEAKVRDSEEKRIFYINIFNNCTRLIKILITFLTIICYNIINIYYTKYLIF